MNRLVRVLLVGSFITLSAIGPAIAASNQGANGIQPVQYYDRDDFRNYGGRSDSWIHERVHEALQDQLGPDANNIRVDVRNRNVYLSGTVGSDEERRAAHEIAHSVPGVNRVFAGRLATGYPGGRSFGYYPR